MQFPVHHAKIIRNILLMLSQKKVLGIVNCPLFSPINVLSEVSPCNQVAADRFKLIALLL
jgi:hypothetical protein